MDKTAHLVMFVLTQEPYVVEAVRSAPIMIWVEGIARVHAYDIETVKRQESVDIVRKSEAWEECEYHDR